MSNQLVEKTIIPTISILIVAEVTIFFTRVIIDLTYSWDIMRKAGYI